MQKFEFPKMRHYVGFWQIGSHISILKNHVLLYLQFVVLLLQCVRMITTGAISISKMMMGNHSLEELNIGGNNIGGDGISAIAGALGNCKISELLVSKCGITLTGARSLATALYSSNTIRVLWLNRNPITVEGALLIVNSAVHNTVCQLVVIDDEYENDEIQKMMNILEYRRRQEVRDSII